MEFDWTKHPHRRFNPLSREWVLVSPHRNDPPWQGSTEPPHSPEALPYDPECYLCPGNERAGGVRNPLYTATFVFDNDFPALLPEAADFRVNTRGLLVAEADRGICLGYVRLVGHRNGQAKLTDPIVSLPAQYTKKPFLRREE